MDEDYLFAKYRQIAEQDFMHSNDFFGLGMSAISDLIHPRSFKLTIAGCTDGTSSIKGYCSTKNQRRAMDFDRYSTIDVGAPIYMNASYNPAKSITSIEDLTGEIEDLDRVDVVVPINSTFRSGVVSLSSYSSSFRIYGRRENETENEFVSYLDSTNIPLVAVPKFGGLVKTGSEQDILMELSGFSKVYESTSMLGSDYYCLIPDIITKCSSSGFCVIPAKIEW